MRVVLLFIIITVCFPAFSQSEDDFDFLYRMTFKLYKEELGGKNYEYKVNGDPLNFFKKTEHSTETLTIAIDSLQKNARLKMKYTNHGIDLILSSKFPNGFKEANLGEVAKIEVNESKLLTSDNKLIKISAGGGFGFGNEFSMKNKGGEITKDVNRILINRQSQIYEVDNADSLIHGSVVYKASFLTDYIKVILSKKDISTTFVINDTEYVLVDILNNKVILEPNQKAQYPSILNLDKDGNVLQGYSMFELYDMKEKDNSIDMNGAFTQKISPVYKVLFDYFKANPDATLEDYKRNVSPDTLKSLRSSKEYLIIETVAPIENNFILYEPVYGVSKTFEVKYKK